MLTPIDIQNKQFKRGFRGYNEDDVNDFLDQIINDYEKMTRENTHLKHELERVKKDNEQYQQLEKNLKDTLLVAQRTAEEVTTHAKENAAEIRENTAKECQNMRRDAELKAKQQLDDAAAKVHAVVAEYDRLVREKNQFLRKVKVTIESELAIINETLTELPDPEAEEAEEKASNIEAAAEADNKAENEKGQES